MAKWIWKFGEFECYHNLQVHSRRQAYGYTEAPVWKLYAPEPAVTFRKKIHTEGGLIRITACGDFSLSRIDRNGNRSFETRGAKEVYLQPGTYMLDVRVLNTVSFPALYIDGAVETDETWVADDMSLHFEPVGCREPFADPDRKPDVFPFREEPISYVQREILPDGSILYDFGRETFAGITVSGLEKDSSFSIYYGESKEEALDPDWSVIHFEKRAQGECESFIPYAFRFIHLCMPGNEISKTHFAGCVQLQACCQYLPLERKGSFVTGQALIDRIWDLAAYTFHLNCREFFLDGIKRDRWVWSADVYQSLFVNRYLFYDKDIEQRTLIALGGKAPFKRHINTIVDYTFFWFMSMYEHYLTYGDLDFIRRMKPQMEEVMRFCEARTDEDGFIRGQEEDWIFIDWAPMDKTGAVCGEQILYAAALEDYANLLMQLGEDSSAFRQRADRLREQIQACFWDEELGAFIDSYESGERNVTRQNNILAYLFLHCDETQKACIYDHVIANDSVEPITTPYFTFYENQVHCLAGHSDFLEASVCHYYGKMLETGATSLYEQFDPAASGAEHYAMYGRPYEKSLCHAWSASPIYLFGRFRLGVKNTGVAYSRFEVSPKLGRLDRIEGRVPVPGGSIFVKADHTQVAVFSDIEGGTLAVGEKRIPIQAGQQLIVNW